MNWASAIYRPTSWNHDTPSPFTIDLIYLRLNSLLSFLAIYIVSFVNIFMNIFMNLRIYYDNIILVNLICLLRNLSGKRYWITIIKYIDNEICFSINK